MPEEILRCGLGGTLAVCARHARLGGRTDPAAVAETLLAISGEDNPGVPCKHLPDWTGRLGVRFVLITNQLPRIGDVSGALASRFIILALRESFYGKENLGLYNELEREHPSILNWALDGRDRLYQRGYFDQPKTAEELCGLVQ